VAGASLENFSPIGVASAAGGEWKVTIYTLEDAFTAALSASKNNNPEILKLEIQKQKGTSCILQPQKGCGAGKPSGILGRLPSISISVTTANALLDARDLTFVRDFEPLFEGLHMRVHAGQAWLLSGPNGAGKTTLLKVLAGLWRADSGEIWFSGERAKANSWPREALIYLGHGAQLKADLTPIENLRWISAVHGAIAQPAQIDAALESLDAAHFDAQAVRSLSAGQRKRVAMSVLQLVDRRLWLLDEPYANLDRGGVALIEGLIDRHCANGGAVVFSAHGEQRARVALNELKLGLQ